MSKKLRRILILTFILSLGLIAVGVLYGPIPTMGMRYVINDDRTEYTLGNRGDCWDNTVVIPAKRKGLPITSVGSYAFCVDADVFGTVDESEISQIKSVKIGKNVTKIGSSAFSGCKGLTTVKFGNNVKIIDSYAFKNCTNLKKVYYNGSIEDWCKINFANPEANPLRYGAELFIKGRSVKNLVLPGSVEEVYNFAFYGCKLDSITIDDNVKGIGGNTFKDSTFYNDEANWEDGVLYIGKHLIVANEYIEGTYKIREGTINIADEAFSYCYGLQAVEMPETVENIGIAAFFESGLVSVNVPSKVKIIDRAVFFGCQNLTSVVLPNGITSIGNYAFYACRGLKSIVIPDSVESIGNSAFNGCEGLESVVIGKKLAVINDQAFEECERIEKVYYRGNASQWSQIYIQERISEYAGLDNTDLTTAKRYYYVESEADVPSDGGRYWHYDENGNPVLW